MGSNPTVSAVLKRSEKLRRRALCLRTMRVGFERRSTSLLLSINSRGGAETKLFDEKVLVAGESQSIFTAFSIPSLIERRVLMVLWR